MNRLVLIAAVAAAGFAASNARGQVLDTYRPSTVTYYSAASAAPASYQQPVVSTGYGVPVRASQLSSASAVPVAYGGGAAPYYASPQFGAPVQTITYSNPPCGCPVVRTAFAAPVPALPVQTVALPPPGTIDSEYFIGQGLLGRPKVFKTGQPLRNVVRRILP